MAVVLLDEDLSHRRVDHLSDDFRGRHTLINELINQRSGLLFFDANHQSPGGLRVKQDILDKRIHPRRKFDHAYPKLFIHPGIIRFFHTNKDVGIGGNFQFA